MKPPVKIYRIVAFAVPALIGPVLAFLLLRTAAVGFLTSQSGEAFSLENASWEKFSTLRVEGLRLRQGAWAAEIDDLSIRFQPVAMIFGKPEMASVSWGSAQIYREARRENHAPQAPGPKPAAWLREVPTRLAGLAALAAMVPEEFRLKHTTLRVGDRQILEMSTLCQAHGRLTATATLAGDQWEIGGTWRKKEKNLQIHVKNDSKEAKDKIINFKASDIFIHFSSKTPAFLVSLNGLEINHEAVAAETLRLKELEMGSALLVSKKGFSTHGSTFIRSGNVEIRPEIMLETGDSVIVHGSLNLPEQPVEGILALFREFSPGLWPQPLTWKGQTGAKVAFSLNPDHPEKLEFSPQVGVQRLETPLQTEKFITALNGAFIHTPPGQASGFRIEPSAKRNIQNAVLRKAVVISEDPDFFSHSGADPAGIRLALVENLKNGKFERGGGSITAQTVRNLWLNQQKNLARKVQEMAISLALEQSGLLSKGEILDLYLSVAEFGPGVYGVNDGARFYFNKAVADLNTDEAIFLAGVLPNPAAFETLFNPDGSLSPYAEGYFHTMRYLLVAEEVVTENWLDRPLPTRKMLRLNEAGGQSAAASG